MQPLGDHADQEAQELLLGWAPFHPEILVESHAAGMEDQIAGTRADRRGGDGWDAQGVATSEDGAADGDFEEVQAVDEQVHAIEEIVDPIRLDPFGKLPERQLGVDVARHARQRLDLGLAQSADHGADLAIEVGKLECIEIGDGERADTQPGEG